MDEDMVKVLEFQIVVDPAWVGSITPYRIIRDGRLSRPMDLADAQREMRYSLEDAERKGVRAIEGIRNQRQWR